MIDKKDILLFIQEQVISKDTQIDNETNLLSLGLDSLGMMKLLLFLQKKLEIEIPLLSVEPKHFKNITSISQWLNELNELNELNQSG